MTPHDHFEPDLDAWHPWTPAQANALLRDVPAPWYVAGGWAIDLFIGARQRHHDDLEIGVPRDQFGELVQALHGYDLFVVGGGKATPLAAARHLMDRHHQTWVRDPASGHWVIDIFREPSRDGRWVARRDARLALPMSELIMHTADGIPFACPEVVLLFKAKACRPKDEADFDAVVPAMEPGRRRWLRDALCMIHPGHRWLQRLP